MTWDHGAFFPWFKVGKCGACSVAGGKEPAVREGLRYRREGLSDGARPTRGQRMWHPVPGQREARKSC